MLKHNRNEAKLPKDYGLTFSLSAAQNSLSGTGVLLRLLSLMDSSAAPGLVTQWGLVLPCTVSLSTWGKTAVGITLYKTSQHILDTRAWYAYLSTSRRSAFLWTVVPGNHRNTGQNPTGSQCRQNWSERGGSVARALESEV